MLPRRKPVWFHPLLLSIFPALSLLAANVDQVRLAEGLRLTLVSLLLGLLVYAAFGLLLRSPGRGAPAASLTVVALLTYGRLYDGLKAIGLPGETIVRHRYLLPAWLLLVGLGVLWCARRRETAALNRILNVVSVAAIAFPLVSLAAYGANTLTASGATAGGCTLRPPAGEPLPDVYIIIMDAYERDDVLREFHGYDNSPFLTALEDRGFYVAYGSMSNYQHTELSLPSFLNMDYAQTFPQQPGDRLNVTRDLVPRIKHSLVRRELECLGYLTVATPTGVSWTEWSDADFFLDGGSDLPGSLGTTGRISRLEIIFLDTTIARTVSDGWQASRTTTPAAGPDAREAHRERILRTFDGIDEILSLASPKLVFMHVLSPHPPFVFGAKGEPVAQAQFETTFAGAARDNPLLQAYADQVTYLNQLLLEAIDAILEDSQPRPIIVLMGDHGWADRNPEDKLSILNAYLVPPQTASLLEPTITPVNSFRLIFDSVFGGSYGDLPNVSYFSTEKDIYEFTVVPNTWMPDGP